MSDQTPSTPSSTLYIPPELLREIFPYCDTPTLGNVCKANRACLEIASPFLYTHIVLDSIESVVKLFLLETTAPLPSSPSSISPPSPIASLPRLVPLSRIRTFTYLSLSRTAQIDDLELPPNLPRTLLPNPPLPVDVLILNLQSHQNIQPDHHTTSVLDLFNPSIFVLRGRALEEEEPEITADLTFPEPTTTYHDNDVPPHLPSWNRLTSIVISNSTTGVPIPSLGLDRIMLAKEAEEGANHASFLLCFDFLDPFGASSWCFHSFFPSEACNVWDYQQRWIPEGTSVRLVAWVGSQKEKEELERETVRYARDKRFAFGEQPGAKFEVVVEVHPSRAGRRDREDAWSGKTIESWR